MLTERGVKILKILIENDDNISISQLANTFNLSERSIRYDIEKINKVLRSNSLPLIERIGVGNLSLKQKKDVLEYINSLDDLIFSSESRQKFILYKAVLTGEINLTTISKKLIVSRTTVKKDVEEVKKILQTSRLKLVQSYKRGLIIQGNENDIRNMQLTILSDQLNKSKSNELLIKPVVNDYKRNVNLAKIDQFINKIEKETNNIISDRAYYVLKMYILITIRRSSNGYVLSSHADNEHLLLSTPEFDIIKKHMSILEEVFHINFNQHEIIKITNLFISSPSYNFPEDFYKHWFEIETFVNKLVHDFSHEYNLDLTNDKELIRDLITYLKPTLHSNQKKPKSNRITDTYIEKVYPHIHSIISNLLTTKSDYKLKEFNNDHIAAITIYFIAAVERNKYKIKTKKNVLIVCGMGYGTSKLIKLQLKQNYNVNIVDSIPLHYVKNYNKMENVDIIVTTSKKNLNGINKPVVNVNPRFTQDDIKALDRNNLQKLKRQIPLSKIMNIFKTTLDAEKKMQIAELLKDSIGELIFDDISTPKSNLIDYLPTKNIAVNIDAKNWKEAIKFAGNLLVENGYVKTSYVDSLINAFKKYGAYMLISDKVAIPHTKNNNDILKTGMVLITLQDEVKTPSGKDLKVIFAFASFDNLEHLDALSEFSNLLLNSNFKEVSSTVESPQELLDFIKANITQN